MKPSNWTLLLLMGANLAACGEDPVAAKDPGNQAVPSDWDPNNVTDLPEGSPDQDHDGYTLADGDCDDNDGSVFPDQAELCDLKDNNCDGVIDEGFDLDGDGHLPMTCAVGDDCDDTNSAISPSATEIPYDGVDQDCSGADSLDADNDGFDSIDYGGNDCNDNDPDTFPGAPEVAKDGLDQDCDGEDSLDSDEDGYDDIDFGGRDCDDYDASINPGAFDWFNDAGGVDSDCDGADGVATDLNDAQLVLSGTVSRGDLLGYTVATCDLNGDGTDDLIVGAPLATSNRGEVGVFFGSGYENWATGLSLDDADIVLSGQNIGFGLHTRCGDVDGDGTADLLVSRGEYGSSYNYQINVFYGGSTWSSAYNASDADAIVTMDLGASGSSLYTYTFELADLDDDGDDELFFFAPTSAGLSSPYLDDAIWIVNGGTMLEGAVNLVDIVDRRINPSAIDAFSGMSVEPDLNGDGKPDLVLAMGLADDGSGYATGNVSFISGIPASSGSVEDLAWASVDGTTGLESATGYDVAFGDFDGDGNRDMILGVPLADAGARVDVGQLRMVSDVETALTGMGLDAETLTDFTVDGGYTNGVLGVLSIGVEDLDGDGTDDVLAVEPGAGTGGRGRTTVMSGSLISSGEIYVENTRMIEFTHPNAYTGVASDVGIADFDGDGIADYWVSAPGYGLTSSGSGYSTGRVYLFTSSTYTHVVP